MDEVLVIGAGLAGTIVANELCSDFKVTIIDRGPSGKYQEPNLTETGKSFGQVTTFCYGEGGSTNLWHNGLIEIPEKDIVDPSFKRFYLSLSKWTEKAARLLGFEGDYRDEKEAIAKTVSIEKDAIDSILVPEKKGKLNLDRKNLFLSYSFVRQICRDGDEYLVTIQNCDGAKEYRFKHIVLAAGGLNTPNIVNDIFLKRQSTIGFIDHPMGFVGKIRVKAKYVSDFEKMVSLKGSTYEARLGIRFNYNGLQHIVYFRPCYSIKNNLNIQRFKSKLGCSVGLGLIRAACNFKVFHPDVLFEIYKKLFGKFPKTKTFSTWVVFEQKSHKKSTIQESRGGLTVNWNLDELKDYSEALKELKKKLGPYTDHVSIVEKKLEDWLWSAAHYSGSVENTLLVKNVQLKGFENVFIADSSVISEHSYVNTGLTIAKIALEVVNRIKSS